MKAVILAAVLIHFSEGYSPTVGEGAHKCPISLVFGKGTGKKSVFPEYEGKIFIPLIGEPYKNKSEAENECKLLKGEPANLYSAEHLDKIVKFIRDDRRNGEIFEKHGGQLDLRIGMQYNVRARKLQALRFRDKSEGPFYLQDNWIFNRSIRQLYFTPRRSVIIRVRRRGKFQTKFLYRAKSTDCVIGVLCELEPPKAPNTGPTKSTVGYTGPLGVPIMKSPKK